MTKRPEPADFVDAFVQFATASIDAWATSVAAMSDKVDRGSYTASDWVMEAGAWAGSMVEASTELYDTILKGARGSRILSQEYRATPAQMIGGVRRLRLVGPLQAITSSGTISVTAVKFDPPELQGAVVVFQLSVDPAGLHGDAYLGKVEVLSAAGVVEQTIDVMIQVP